MERHADGETAIPRRVPFQDHAQNLDRPLPPRPDHRVKRGGAEALTAELTDCLPDPAEPTPAEAYDAARTRDAINRFLAGLPSDRRTLFVNRYFFGVSVAALAASSGLSQANVKVILHRMRGELKKRLEEEGIPL